jgi:hypothetical protein
MAKRKSEESYEQEAAKSRHRKDERSPVSRGPTGSAGGDRHAAGEWSGGTAVGGRAGSNEGDGSPRIDELQEAAGGSDFDEDLEMQDEPPYGGPSGGAVGGTPANKRVTGGRTHRGIAPEEPNRGDSTIGSDEDFKKDDPSSKSHKKKGR